MGCKIEVDETIQNDFNFCSPRQSGAHGACHSCINLDTPLVNMQVNVYGLCMMSTSVCRHKQLLLTDRKKQQYNLSCIWEILNAS